MEKMTNEEALSMSKKIWNNFYDYSLFNYTNARTKIKLICPIHGEFEQSFHTHLRSGCYECGKIKRRKKNVIECFNQKHNFKYDYSKTSWTGNDKDVIVICPIHGEFKIRGGNHKNGDGCHKCVVDNQKIEIVKKFIESVNKTHNFKYDYKLM